MSAEEEKRKSPEDKIKDELLELKMRYEMDEISEDEFKKEETRLKKELRDMREGHEKEATKGSPERSRGITGEKPEKKPRKGKT